MRLSTVLLRLCTALVAGMLLAGQASATDDALRPRIGLVLSGGGARGAAHIGVLEVLQELRVPVDCIAATSMGALVGGAYAAGVTPAEMRTELAPVDWNDLFIDNADYSEQSYRNKRLEQNYIPGMEIGLTADGVRTRLGVRDGQKVKLLFNRLVRANRGERLLEQLPLPLVIVSTDIGNGDRVVLRNGSLSAAMRASMSVPGLLAPASYDGRELVDGGLMENLPIDALQDFCQPDVVIAVNTGTPPIDLDQIDSVWTVLGQSLNILMQQNVARSRAALRPQDIYLEPDLGTFTNVDFASYDAIAGLGRKSALRQSARLRELAISESDYAAWWEHIRFAANATPRIDTIAVSPMSYVNPETVRRHIEQTPGARLERNKLDRDVMRIFGDGYYQSVDYAVLDTADGHVLRIDATEKTWGKDYLRFGLNLNSNPDSSTYNLRAIYHDTWINYLGAELQIGGQIGSEPGAFVQFYQPLDERQTLFFQPEFNYLRRDLPVFVDNEHIADYDLSDYRTSLIAGTNISVYGQAWFGWLRRSAETELITGTKYLPEISSTLDQWQIGIDLDQRNKLFFPTEGWAANLTLHEPLDLSYSKVSSELRGAFSLGDYVFQGRIRYVDSPHGNLPITDAEGLGGPMNLSGFAPNQILGDEIRYANLRTERIVGKMPLGLTGDMRLGLSLETGRVNRRYTEPNRDGWLDSTAIYLGGEIPLGVAFIGYGYSSAGSSMLYLFIGTPWM